MRVKPAPTKTERRFRSDDERWKAVVRKDPAADGDFYYAVKTTGVYCRTGCASRVPRRENVSFHTSCEAAERAGFRPCKRCQPNRPAFANEQAERIARACDAITAADDGPRLESLARSAGMSVYHFHRLFTRIVGVTPKAYAAAQRAERMRKALAQRTSVTAAIYQSGFSSNSRFYEKASSILGMPARRFRDGGKDATIRFAVGECSLGSILVASSDRGICAISLGDDPDALARELQDRFRNATLIGADRKFERLVSRVIGFVDTPSRRWDLPLDVRGTAFQRKVWEALRAIPPGATLTYSELAKRIGSRKAARAVAGACAANLLAVAIPCHRVLRTDGSLSGYRWGVERKRRLLRKERLQ